MNLLAQSGTGPLLHVDLILLISVHIIGFLLLLVSSLSHVNLHVPCYCSSYGLLNSVLSCHIVQSTSQIGAHFKFCKFS